MKPTEIQTNLIGQRVQITMGCVVDDRTREIAKGQDSQRIPGWKHFGETAEVVAAYKKDDGIMLGLALDMSGELIEVYLTHVRKLSN